MSRKQKTAAARIAVLYIPLFIVLALVLIPFLWAVSTSFKTIPEFQSETLHYLPQSLNFDNYSYVWGKSGFSTYFVNSVIVSSLSVVVVILLCICNAYALSRYKFRGKSGMTLLLKTIKLIDSPAALVIFNIILQTPFNTLLMRSFVNGVPKELDEAAMVDGAGRMTIMCRILLPVLKPGIVAVSAFTFIGCWNEFLVAFTFIQTQRKFTIPVGLKTMIGEYSVNYPALAAGSVIALIPPVILFAIIQKHLVAGLSAGAVKG